MDHVKLLQAIQDSEINFQISTMWDSGFDFTIGDRMNGTHAEKNFDKFEDGVEWTVKEVLRLYPNSGFAKKYYAGGIR